MLLKIYAWALVIAVSAFVLRVEPVPTLHTKDTALAFTAEWCGPCQKDKKFYPRLARTYRLLVYDVDDYPNVAKKYKVRKLPTYVVLRRNREIKRTTDIHELLR